MEYQFGKNPEFTIYLFTDFSYWALPVSIYWSDFSDDSAGKNLYFSLRILCFYLGLEIWKWKKE